MYHGYAGAGAHCPRLEVAPGDIMGKHYGARSIICWVARRATVSPTYNTCIGFGGAGLRRLAHRRRCRGTLAHSWPMASAP